MFLCYMNERLAKPLTNDEKRRLKNLWVNRDEFVSMISQSKHSKLSRDVITEENSIKGQTSPTSGGHSELDDISLSDTYVLPSEDHVIKGLQQQDDQFAYDLLEDLIFPSDKSIPDDDLSLM